MTLIYGVDYRLKNGWDNWRGGYLDGRMDGGVSTANYNQTINPSTDGLGSVWYILSATGKERNAPVLAGDVIHLKNRGFVSYLDTRGSGCNDDLLCVSLSASQDREPGSGRWKIVPTQYAGENSPIDERMPFRLINGWNDGKGGYLNTRGYAKGTTTQGNVPLLLNVSTHEGEDSPETTSWWAER